jgi:carboxyl-terminal processing protease
MLKRFAQKSICLVLCIGMIFCISSGIVYGNNGDNLDAKLNKLKNIIECIQENYVEEISEDDLMLGAYFGVFEILDPHSTYYIPEELKLFESVTSGKFGGVGLTVEMKNDRITVISTMKGTPARKAGIIPGDIIVSIDGTDMTKASLEEAMEKMRGEQGTTVNLGIEREGEVLQFELKREIIRVSTVKHKILPNNIGYIQIQHFNENTGENFNNALKDLLNRKVKGLILDLRNNPGGFINEAINVIDPLVPKEIDVAHIQFRDKIIESFSSSEEQINKPLVVLINGGSASASEMVAGAIQDTKSGIIVGTRSYGKGTVQAVFSASDGDGSGFKLTVAKYLTSNKRDIEGIGIEPDIIVANLNEQEWEKVQDFVPMIEEKDAVPGDRGLNVYGAQQRLNFIGYEDVHPTGIFDEITLNAINNFQQAYSLSQTGILDQATRQAIIEKMLIVLEGGREDLQLKKAIEILDKQ